MTKTISSAVNALVNAVLSWDKGGSLNIDTSPARSLQKNGVAAIITVSGGALSRDGNAQDSVFLPFDRDAEGKVLSTSRSLAALQAMTPAAIATAEQKRTLTVLMGKRGRKAKTGKVGLSGLRSVSQKPAGKPRKPRTATAENAAPATA